MRTNAHPAPWPRTSLAPLLAALLGATACGSEAPACPPPRECALPPACPAVAAFDAATLAVPEQRLVVEVLQHLFQGGDFAQVRALFTPALAQDLVPEKLSAIVRGLVQAHGPPVQIMDVWTSELKEKDERMPAAELLLKMANETRVNLILVFDAAGAVKGLWLRPI